MIIFHIVQVKLSLTNQLLNIVMVSYHFWIKQRRSSFFFPLLVPCEKQIKYVYFHPKQKSEKRVNMSRRIIGSSAVNDKMFLESRVSQIPGTYFKLGQVKVPRIQEALDSRNILSSTSLDPNNFVINHLGTCDLQKSRLLSAK